MALFPFFLRGDVMPIVSIARFRGRLTITDNVAEVANASATLPATASITITGTACVAGDTVTITQTPPAGLGSAVVTTYTVLSSDVASGTLLVQQATIAANLVAQINVQVASPTSFFATAVTGSSQTVTLRTWSMGVDGNSATYAAAASPGTVGHITVSSASGSFAGGGASSVIETSSSQANAIGTSDALAPAAFSLKHAASPMLLVPAVSGDTYISNGSAISGFIQFNAGEPIMVDKVGYAAAIAAGISFQSQ